jgi:tRNA dimethylallyltransferase
LYALVGETASGKSEAAHSLALRLGWVVCSADSMAVYRFMDRGTAKPSPAMRKEVRYLGLDLVDPDEPFSVGKYVEMVAPAVEETLESGIGVIVAGGSGLYVKALTEGLSPGPASSPDRVEFWTSFWNSNGAEAAWSRLLELNPAWRGAIADRANPRRMIRALVLAEQGAGPPGGWTKGGFPELVGLRYHGAERERRIARRARNMYDLGLLDETRSLLAGFPGLSGTARHAIGYAEAAGCLAGRFSAREALEQTVRRSRQFAKRQRTWFRTQLRVSWVECGPGEDAAAISERVLGEFQRIGPVPRR